MLLSIEVSLYCPRFVVMDVKDGKARIIHMAVNDHLRESSMAQRNRTPVGELLLEIAEKLEFILTAYPITNAVWSMRQLGVVNAEAAKIALGSILLTLSQHGIHSDELTRSRAQLYLTGTSKSDSKTLRTTLAKYLTNTTETHLFPLIIGTAWYLEHQQIVHSRDLKYCETIC